MLRRNELTPNSDLKILLGLPKRGRNGAETALKVRDLWETSDIGSATGTYTAKKVRSHASVFLKLTV